MEDPGDRGTNGPFLVRGLLLAGLALLLVLGVPEGPDPEGAPGPRMVEASAVVGAGGWEALLRHGAEAPLHARISGDPPPLELVPPVRLRAGRPTSVEVEWTPPFGPELTLTGPAGVVDTLTLDQDGAGAFVLNPRTPGPAIWELEGPEMVRGLPTGPDSVRLSLSAEVGGWVEAPRPLRILALSGPPTSEARLAIRALEEAGEEVESWIHLGRDLWVGRGREPGPLPADVESPAAFDLVVVFPGLEVGEGLRAALDEAVTARGRGLLLAGGAGWDPEILRWFGHTDAGPAPTSVRGDAIEWTLPPEIPPLPPAEVTSPLRSPGEAEAGASPLSLTARGRGRIGLLHLTESWRWRMEGDAVEGHRAFWRGLADWLSAGWSEDPVLEVLGEDLRVGEVLDLRLLTRDPDRIPAGVRITAPSGPLDLAAPSPVPLGGLFLQEVRSVVLEPGVHRVQSLDGEGEALTPGLGVVVRGVSHGSTDPEGRLARIAAASPGGSVGWGPGAPIQEPMGEGRPWPLLLFLGLVAAAFAEWVMRRRRGLP
ncbi:MAG: hypothetical protein EA422_05035 [Gemmatimonadales bacterium]|nr:MAG: hypothetical protein EA422_05035 [Gemmatimonadales bacterium]